jgi:hypothetical protein
LLGFDDRGHLPVGHDVRVRSEIPRLLDETTAR